MSDLCRSAVLVFGDDLTDHGEDLHRDLHGLGHVLRAVGAEGEFLNAHAELTVRAAVDAVERRDRDGLDAAAGDVAIELHVLRAGSGLDAGNGRGIDSVAAELGFVGRAVELDHAAVNGGLIRHVHTDDGRADDVVYVVDGVVNALAAETVRVSVHQNDRLVHTDRSACRGRAAAQHAALGDDVHFNDGPAFAVKNLTGANGLDLIVHVQSFFSFFGTYIILKSQTFVPVLPVSMPQLIAVRAS